MIRRLRWFIAAFFTFYCSSLLAVGMGELVLNSALNQRFDAEIELTGRNKLERQEIVSKLASLADFDLVGIDRDYQLNDLRFAVKSRFDGDYYLHITSTKPIIEPFLNFIVEVTWPTGRILREYTVLLDPPVFDLGKVEGIDLGSSSQRYELETLDERRSNKNEERGFPLSSVTAGTESKQGQQTFDEYLIGAGDTLWEIAQKVRPDKSMPVPPILLALQRENPEAFIRNNINLLKAGYVLRIPDLTDPSTETLLQAVAEVKAQNEEYESVDTDELTQLDAGQRARFEDRGFSRSPGSDELRLIASAGQSGSRSGSGDDMSAKLENSLSAVREELDVTRRSNNELAVRLDDLATQVQTLNDIVSLKDDQLAALQTELEQARSDKTSSLLTAATPQSLQSGKPFSFLNNPITLLGIAIGLIGVVVAGMALVRRRREADAADNDIFESASMEESTEETRALETDLELAEEREEIAQEPCQVIVEADSDIAHGRFAQAISSLQTGLQSEPDRADLQLKLLEVYVRTEDLNAFDLQLQLLKKLGDAEAEEYAVELEKQIAGRDEASLSLTGQKIEDAEAVTDNEDLNRLLSEDKDVLWRVESTDLNLDKPEGQVGGDMEMGTEANLGVSGVELAEEIDLEDELFLDLEALDIDEEAEAIELNLDAGDEVALDIDDDLDLDQDAGSKLGLARAYIEMGDNDGARGVLQEVVKEGTESESAEARELLDKLD